MIKKVNIVISRKFDAGKPQFVEINKFIPAMRQKELKMKKDFNIDLLPSYNHYQT